MRVLVTGGAGFMGSHLAEALYSGGHEVAVLDDLSGSSLSAFPPATEPSGFYEVDLRDATLTNAAIEDFAPDVFCHLAANAREGASQFQPADVTARNMLAYANALSAAIKHGAKKVVLYSSMAVYGDQEPPFDETMSRRPVDVYGVNKAAMERITEILAGVHGFQYTIIRPHNVFGERQALAEPYRNVIGIWMNRIMRGEPLLVYGDGMQQRAFSYIGDAVGPMVRACDLDGSLDGEAINLGGTVPRTLNEIADMVCDAMGASPLVQHVGGRPLEVKRAWCTYEKSERLLGFRERVGVEKGIRRMAAWAKERGPQEWWDRSLELGGPNLPEAWR